MLSFGRFQVDAFLLNLASSLGLGEDPRIVYSLAAAVLLALVSLLSGWGRLDLAALFRPANLLRLCAGALLAFGLVALADSAPVRSLPDDGLTAGLLNGLARLPLYVLALAYGPTIGLVAGALFAAATAIGPYPDWTEGILMLELTILGWLAISPSPRRHRWAGSLGAVLAYVLALGTAGLAFHVWRTGQLDLATLLAEQSLALPGLVAAWFLLAAVGPSVYQRYFPGSRIRPPDAAVATTSQGAGTERADTRRERSATPTLELPLLERRRRPHGRRLVDQVWRNEDPNG